MTFHHRRALFISLARFIGLPALLVHLGLRFAKFQSTSWLHTILVGTLYVLSVPLFWSIRNCVRLRLQDREARRRGARPIPRIKGKWPGNIDVLVEYVSMPLRHLSGAYYIFLISMFKTMQKGYIGECEF
jgi:hypothetical protein